MPDDQSTFETETETASAAHSPTASWSERMLDQALPDELDWQQKVQSYPLVALAVATGLGFALGRSRGSGLVSALTGLAAHRVTSTIANVLDPSER